MKLDNPLAMVIKGNNGSFKKCFGGIKKLRFSLFCKLLKIKAGRGGQQKHPYIRVSLLPAQSAQVTMSEDMQSSLWARSLSAL